MSGDPSTMVPRGDLRRGILEPDTWERILRATIRSWNKRGCLLEKSKTSKTCSQSALFNYWSAEQTARIDFVEKPAEPGQAISADRERDAPIELKQLPYLNRTAVIERPSFLIFEVTGHVMFGIYFGNLKKPDGSLKRPELHILNPWNLTKTKQLEDVYILFEKTLKFKPGKDIVYIDVVNELESALGDVMINLQENERIGFCTLWAGIIANQVIQILPELTRAVELPPAPASQLSKAARTLYYTKVYEPLIGALDTKKKDVERRLPELNDVSYLAAAEAVAELSQATFKGGKRTAGRRTYRKKLKWKHRGPRSSLTVRRTARRSVRYSGRLV